MHSSALAEVEDKHAAALADAEGKLTGDVASLQSARAEAEAKAASLQAQLNELAQKHRAGVVADAEVTARAALHLAAVVTTREEAQAEVHAMKERMQKMESLHANDCAAHASELQVRA